MSQGADNRAVAQRLHISYATVRTHVRSILAKLGAHSRLQATADCASRPVDIRARLLASDVIYVGGGSMSNLLATRLTVLYGDTGVGKSSVL